MPSKTIMMVNDNQKTAIMAETADQLIKMIQSRVRNRIQALSALSMTTMDHSSIPDDVKMMREFEASKIRAVMEEQTDLIEIIQMLFPRSMPAKISKVDKTTEKRENIKKTEKK